MSVASKKLFDKGIVLIMGTRRKGRELALQALYQIEITGDGSVAAMELFLVISKAARAKEFAVVWCRE